MQKWMGALLYMQVFLYIEVNLEYQKVHGCFWLTLSLVDSIPISKSGIWFPIRISITGRIKSTVLHAC